MPPKNDSALSSALRISVMRLSRRLRAERSDTQLTLNQLSALATLDRHGALCLGELAAHERVQPPSMTRTVDCLQDLGLITRTAHATDRRQVVIAISAAGVHLLTEDRRRRDAWLACRLRELSPAERDVLRAAAPILERLAQA
ncbi:MAG: MarR family transcriptional regulator [Actinomycetota bacterium]|nr:MarR family transcriptional regulator [Actinomycetota bacterium]